MGRVRLSRHLQDSEIGIDDDGENGLGYKGYKMRWERMDASTKAPMRSAGDI